MKITIEGTPDEIKKALQAVQSEERHNKSIYPYKQLSVGVIALLKLTSENAMDVAGINDSETRNAVKALIENKILI
ncbi:hypothetical protein [Lacticaseibacillus saniviri]|uniref:hypothetical protein n=1 Tax=Lacticaseibacillus saniviri TaxID=931533 RepID=UPI0007048F59|nr:hypothetical protein [Lacticaseibacillus saniviri]